MNKLKCQKCNKEIKEVLVNTFRYDESDSDDLIPVKQVPHNAVIFETTVDWTGYELTDEERKETILCPFCHQYPLKADFEIQTYEFVRVVCFKK